MKLLFALILVFVSFASGRAQYTWASQVSNTSDYINDIDFAPTGNAIGIYGTYGGQIGRTNNGGLTWTTPYTLPLYNSESFSDVIVGTYIDDAQNCVVATNAGQFYNSLDGGVVWNMNFSNGPGYCHDMEHSNGRIFVGGTGEVYFSDDIGATWDSVDVNIVGSVLALSFQGNSGVAIGVNEIYVTDDLGATWTELTSLPHLYDMNDVVMVNSTTIFTVGLNGEIFGTDNLGVNWTSVVSGTAESLYKIEFGNATNGLISGSNGTLLMTATGGFDPWDVSTHGASNTENIFALHAHNSTVAWFGNDLGDIYAAPDPGYDIEIISLVRPDTACFYTDFDFTIKFVATVGDAVNPEFQFLVNGNSVFGSYIQYAGVVLNGDTAEFTVTASADDDQLIDAFNTISIQGYTFDQSFIAWYFPPSSDIYLKGYDPYTVSGPHEFCPGDFISISASGGDSYSWIGNVDSPFLPSNIVVPLVSTNYLINIEQEYCTIVDTVFTVLGDMCDSSAVDTIAVPAGEYAFSPNGDNVNDYFVLDYLEGTTNDVRIFNRWGDLLVNFTNYNNEDIVWDGTYGGRKVPGGTYFFVVEYESNLSSSGWVQVVE